jgi:transketolase
MPISTDLDSLQAALRFDITASKTRCRRMRRRILELSQRLNALHVAPAFSCLEIVDTIYYGLMRRNNEGKSDDTFILSKGHGALAQFAVLEELGVMSKNDLDTCCHPEGRLGGHPDYGAPGIEASTGSLGHGLPMALGICLAEQELRHNSTVYVVISDGELMEGSTWEAILLAPSLGIRNLVVFVDLNDFISGGQFSVNHRNLYPVEPKFEAFGWQAIHADGHAQDSLFDAVSQKDSARPLAVIAKTVKGKGVSYMENRPIWHYRSPNPTEYQQALAELAEPDTNQGLLV